MSHYNGKSENNPLADPLATILLKPLITLITAILLLNIEVATHKKIFSRVQVIYVVNLENQKSQFLVIYFLLNLGCWPGVNLFLSSN